MIQNFLNIISKARMINENILAGRKSAVDLKITSLFYSDNASIIKGIVKKSTV